MEERAATASARAADRPTDTSRQHAYLLLATAALALGGVWVAGKIAIAEVGPWALSTARFGLASVVLALWIGATGRSFVRPGARDLPLVAAMALTGVAGFSPFFFLGLERAPASDGAIITPGLAPIVAALIASAAFSERITRRVLLGLAVAVAGLVLVVGPPAEGSDARLVGDLLFVGAAVCWGLYTVLGRAAAARLGPLNATLYALVLGAAILLPLGLVEGGWTGLVATVPSAVAYVYIAVAGTVIAFVFWYEGVARIGVTRASAFTFVVPLTGVTLSAALLGERPGPTTLVGGALVLAALWIIQRAPR